MNVKNLFWGLFACAALSACQNDEIPDGGGNIPVNEKGEAYLSIQLINATGGISRGDDGGFEDGIDAENSVKTVDFYMYNTDGTYNQQVRADVTFTAEPDGTNSIEEFGNVTIVLQNLKQNGQPKYIVALLNHPEGDKLSDYDIDDLKLKLESDYKTSDGHFIMTNSTYNNGDETSGYYGAIIQPENFLKGNPADNNLVATNAVQVYVERLAAKVKVSVDSEKAQFADTDNIPLGTFTIDGKGGQDVSIKILGWGLNALTPNSYLMKNVPAWDYFNPDWTAWDDKGNFRSYWAMSPNYGKGNYPGSHGFNTIQENDKTLMELEQNAEEVALNYYSWNELTQNKSERSKKLGQAAYCLENTNKKAQLELNNNIKATTTHVILAAQTTDKSDLIRFYGKLYTLDGFMSNVESQLPAKYTYRDLEAQGVTSFIPMHNLLEIVNAYDGYVYAKLKKEAYDSEKYVWYVESVDGSNNKLSGSGNGAALIDQELQNIFLGTDGSKREYAEYYREGRMYYCIPIQHLRGGDYKKTYDENTGKYTVNEGDYGVVRNHLYNVTITSIANLGTAVYDPSATDPDKDPDPDKPEEPIVPNPDIQTYYVGAQINILAWKVVNQSVDL